MSTGPGGSTSVSCARVQAGYIRPGGVGLGWLRLGPVWVRGGEYQQQRVRAGDHDGVGRPFDGRVVATVSVRRPLPGGRWRRLYPRGDEHDDLDPCIRCATGHAEVVTGPDHRPVTHRYALGRR